MISRRTTNWMILLYVSSLTCSIFALPQSSYTHQQHQQQQQNQQSFNQNQNQHQHHQHNQYNNQQNPSSSSNNNNNNYQNHAGHQNHNTNYNGNNQLPVQALHSGNSNSLSQSQYPIPPPAPPSIPQQQLQQPQGQSQKLLQPLPQQTFGQKLQQQAFLQKQQSQYYQQQQQQFQNSANRNQVPITSFNNELSHDGSFAYGYTTGDGQAAQAQGFVKNLGVKDAEAQVVQGAYSYTSPDGTPISVKYLADENGFRAEGLHLPTPPPIPEAIARALAYIARVQATNPQLYQQNQQQFSGQYNNNNLG